MADETYLAVAGAHRDLYARYAFYLVAVVGAAVGFALNQTQGTVLAWSQMPLGWRWCADSARWASSGRHVDHRDRRRVMISM